MTTSKENPNAGVITRAKGWLSDPFVTGPVILLLALTIVVAAYSVSRLKEYSGVQGELIETQREVLRDLALPLGDETTKLQSSVTPVADVAH